MYIIHTIHSEPVSGDNRQREQRVVDGRGDASGLPIFALRRKGKDAQHCPRKTGKFTLLTSW